jgi:hypothetical protein
MEQPRDVSLFMLSNDQIRRQQLRRFWGMLFGAAVLALSGGITKAATITASFVSPLPPSGTAPIGINLAGISPPSQSPVTGTGYSIAFSGVAADQGIVQGTTAVHLTPIAGVAGTSPEYLTDGFGSALTTNLAASGNYLSTGLGTITLTFSTPQTSLALLWGTLDAGNSLTFNDASGFVVTGSAVAAAGGASFTPGGFAGTGFQRSEGSVYIVVDTITPFTAVSASSSTGSFEFAGVAAANSPFTTGTPEPSSLVLIGSGIGLVALCVYRRHYQDVPIRGNVRS